MPKRTTSHRAAIALLLLIELLPVWLVRTYPSQDGPSHLYNAWVISHVNEPPFRDYFKLQSTAAGNVAVESATVIALAFLPPRIVDKLIVSVLVISLVFAFASLCKSINPEADGVLLLGFLFPLNFFTQMGFWNFCLSVSLLLYAMAVFFRWRKNREARTVALLFFLSLLTYAAHILSWAILACAVSLVSLIDLVTSIRSASEKPQNALRTLIPALSVLPPALLAFVYGAHASSQLVFSPVPVSNRLKMIALGCLRADVRGDLLTTCFCLLLLLALFALACWNRRPSFRPALGDLLLLMSATSMLLSFFGPEAIGEGLFVRIRFSFYAWLFLAIWISIQSWSKRVEQFTALAVILLASIWSFERWATYRAWNSRLDEFLSLRGHIAQGATLLLVDLQPENNQKVRPYRHAIDLLLPLPFIDLGDYEAITDHFPTAFKADHSPLSSLVPRNLLGNSNREFDVNRFETKTHGTVDYLVFYDEQSNGGRFSETKRCKYQLQRFRMTYISPKQFVRLYARQSKSSN